MRRMKRIGLLICFAGLIALGTENIPCQAQNAVAQGKVSGYTGNNLSAGNAQGSDFSWKYGFSGSNGRYGFGMHSQGALYEPEMASYAMAEGVGGDMSCESGCNSGCYNGSGTVYNTPYWGGCDSCFGIMPFVKDVAHVAFTPVHWVASLLSCGTYDGCGCAPIPYRVPCDPCDGGNNWVGCNTCGGAGCSSCATSGRMGVSAASVASPVGAPAAGEIISDGVVTEEVPSPTSENLPAKAIERSQPVPTGTIKALPAKGVTGGATTIVVPVQAMNPQVRAKARPNMLPMASAQPQKEQAPTYIFVTPEGQVIPQDQVREFAQGNQKGKVQYKVANPNANGIRPVNYERQIPRQAVQPQATGRKVSGQATVVEGQEWRTISNQQYPMAVPQRKYSAGKF